MVQITFSSLPMKHANISSDLGGTILSSKPLQAESECMYQFLSPLSASDTEKKYRSVSIHSMK